MTLATGSHLGPYEVLAPVGAGGMGEVWKARDTRLGREVALKVVHPRFAADAEQLRRFEQEARAASQLDHPNILVVHDVGSHEGSPYIVSELLQGEPLRDRLGSPLPPRKAIEYAVQVAHGLAAAHEKGIVHRDLKPENLFVTKDGRIKILDFGIAKLTQPVIPSVSQTEALTAAPDTEPGVVMGTVAYMSPEQVQGKAVDQRSDLFSLGVVLYEMLSGRRPFQKETAVETMTAILREEPPELPETNRAVSPGLERIVRHCLEKQPSSRFQSAGDMAFDLESLSQVTTAGTTPLRPTAGKRRSAIAASILVVACVMASFIWGKQAGRVPIPSFKRITLRRGNVTSARFTPDLQSVVYSAAWGGKPSELFVQRFASADARSLGVSQASVAGTAGGDVAILRQGGTLARLPLEGGTPRDLLKDIKDATWDLSGARLAVVRLSNGRQRLEYPVGKVLFETSGIEGIGVARFSPDATRIAFLSGPETDESGDVCVVDSSGGKRTLSKGWGAIYGLAWSPDGREIWFSATRAGVRQELHAVSLSGKERLVARFPENAVLQDIAPDGRALVTYGQARRLELRGRMARDAAERDLSWLDGTSHSMLSPDGSQMVFQEWGEGGGAEASTYHWRMGSPSATRLCDGTPMFVSPDWTTVLVGVGAGGTIEPELVPIGAGETRKLLRGPVRNYGWGRFLPDRKRIVIQGTDAEGKARLFIQDVAGGPPRPFGPGDYWGPHTPDGRFIMVRPKPGGPLALLPIEGGEPRPLPFLNADADVPLIFAEDGKSLFVADSCCGGKFPVHVVRLDLETGKKDPWLELSPPDLTGVPGNSEVYVTPNGRFYAYGYRRTLSDLYLVEGLR